MNKSYYLYQGEKVTEGPSIYIYNRRFVSLTGHQPDETVDWYWHLIEDIPENKIHVTLIKLRGSNIHKNELDLSGLTVDNFYDIQSSRQVTIEEALRL